MVVDNNRPRKVVGKVVSMSQKCLCGGKTMQGLLLMMSKSIECGVLCKLDIEKTFDYVYGDFLL